MPGHRSAYYALSWGNDRGQLRRGLDLAKKVQQAIVMGELRRTDCCTGPLRPRPPCSLCKVRSALPRSSLRHHALLPV